VNHTPNPKRILLADDEPAIQFVVGAHLQRVGHVVDIAGNGLQAWQKVSAEPGAYDVVVTDFNMPQLGGMGLAQRLQDAGFAGKVIVYSSSLTPRDKEDFRALGVEAILEKGCSIDELLEEVIRPAARGVRR